MIGSTKRTVRRGLALGLVAVLGVACGASEAGTEAQSGTTATPAGEDGDGSFYEGKTIEILTSAPGGNIDTTARLLGKYLSEHLEGNPTVQVTNIEAGGGLMVGNTFAQRDPDGTTLVFLSATYTMPAVFGEQGVEYDLTDMRALYAADRGASTIMVTPDAGIDTAEQLDSSEDKLFFGAVNPAGIDLAALLGFDALELMDNIETIIGYEGAESIRGAYDSGELHMSRESTPTFVEEFAETETALYTHGVADGAGGRERDPMLPDVPSIDEVYEQINGSAPSGEKWEAFTSLLDIISTGGYTMWTHGDAPPEAITALDEALAEVVEDPGFQDGIEPVLGVYPQITGEEAADWAAGTFNSLDASMVEYWKTFIRDHFDLEYGG